MFFFHNQLWLKAQRVAGGEHIVNAVALSLKGDFNARAMQMPIYDPLNPVFLQNFRKGGGKPIRQKGRIVHHHRNVAFSKLFSLFKGHTQPHQFPLKNLFILCA